ncbi:MFS transporter [Candidatus Pelagibacter communis]|uniref:MFS transporter n=1 Tax=Pelagibacter ubique TaxID=198252 RepID=UPI00094C0EEF|nr:MFS transporter [Candidatus Pelagibacter ubique]
MIKISINKKIIIFGFIFTFFSSFGQSFFLGLFNAPIRNELGITHGQFGNIYAMATIFSSVLLIWVGKKIDEYQIFYYSFFVIILLFLSSLFFSFINSIYLLAVGIFLMRFSGQGLMSHTSTTTISRFFEKSRGKALSTIWFGLSSAEFILPVFVTYFFVIYSWRTVWQGIAIIIILFLPIVIFNTIRSVKLESREKDQNPKINLKIKSWRRVEVIKDFRFYIVSLNMLAMPWVATGVFVYQSFITESKMWGIYTIPKAFMVYSITSIVTLFFSGFLVDKFTSRKLIPLMNIPLLFAMLVLFYYEQEISAFIFLGLIGVSNGLANVLGSSTWAEIYGVKYIGAIKALTTALMVFSTAFGTAVFGILIDSGYVIENIALIAGIYIIVSLALLISIRSTLEPVILKK